MCQRSTSSSGASIAGAAPSADGAATVMPASIPSARHSSRSPISSPELSAEDGTSGTTQMEVWLDGATGLPLRHVEQGATTSPQVIGDVHYQERYELILTSLDPRR